MSFDPKTILGNKTFLSVESPSPPSPLKVKEFSSLWWSFRLFLGSDCGTQLFVSLEICSEGPKLPQKFGFSLRENLNKCQLTVAAFDVERTHS